MALRGPFDERTVNGRSLPSPSWAHRGPVPPETERSPSEERLVRDTILDSMEEGVLLLDPTGRRVFANAALGRHLGTIPESADGLLPLDLQRAAKQAATSRSVTRTEADTGAP